MHAHAHTHTLYRFQPSTTKALATTENHVSSGKGKTYNNNKPLAFKIRNKSHRNNEGNHVPNKSSPPATGEYQSI